MNKIIITLLLTVIGTNCAAQYTIDTLDLNNTYYADSIYFSMKQGKIEGVIEYNEGQFFFNLKNSRTLFKDIAFFKVIGECVAIVSDKNYMKPKNELEFYSIKGDSTIRISNIDSISHVIEIKNERYHLLFLEIYVNEAGSKSIYYEVIIVNKETCQVQYNTFSKKWSIWNSSRDHTMITKQDCFINVYIKEEKVYVAEQCSEDWRLGKHEKIFIFSEKEGKFILYNPTINEKK